MEAGRTVILLLAVATGATLAALGLILLPRDVGDDINQTADGAAEEPLGLEDIRSVTFYVFPFEQEKYYESLKESIPSIKGTGFNTIWIVNPWWSFNPKPLTDPPLYDDSRFEHLQRVLDLLRDNGMRAILGLNYLGKGWSPEGIDPGRWITDPKMYQAFETYVGEFLSRIEDYHDMVYIIVFTEATEPEGLNPYADAKLHAAYLRETLGSLPTRLDPEIRGKFLIGYHDYSIINLDWGRGDSPIQLPNSFDFVSMVFYGWEDKIDAEIRAEFDHRAEFFEALYPDTPLIVGEMGASLCDHGEENQARVIATKASQALSRNRGFNLWHWRPIPNEDGCENPAFRGLAVTNEDGTQKPVVDEIRALLVVG